MASYVNPGITLDINEFEPPGMATIFFSDIQSDTLNYHTPRLMYKGGNQDNIVEFTVSHGMVIM